MAIDIDKVKMEGIVFKGAKKEAIKNFTPKKPKGKTISGAAKMKAAYRARKKK